MPSDPDLTESHQIPTFANPKSRILACPREVTNRFAGLMSRWVIPAECAASKAVGDLDGQRKQGIDRRVVARQMRCFSVVPSRNSMTMNDRSPVPLDLVNGANVGMVQR